MVEGYPIWFLLCTFQFVDEDVQETEDGMNPIVLPMSAKVKAELKVDPEIKGNWLAKTILDLKGQVYVSILLVLIANLYTLVWK